MADPYSAKPWLKFYDKHVPPNLECPEDPMLMQYTGGTTSLPKGSPLTKSPV